MTDKREVEEIVLSQIPTKDRSCGWPAFWRDTVVPYREKELIAALIKISQLEQQILEIQGNAAIRFAEVEARWHRTETAINEAYEFAHDGFPTSCEERLEEYFFQPEGQESAAEGGRG